MGSQVPEEQTPPAPLQAAALEESVHSPSRDVVLSAAANPALTEDLALSLLKQTDLPAECLVALSKNASVSKYRKVRTAIVAHGHTPRHVSLPMLRLQYTFDLMQVALAPIVAADIKRAAEEVLLAKLGTISAGERLTLARRASGRIAAALLFDKEPRMVQAALENPRLTEASIAKALNGTKASSALVEGVCQHPRWSVVREIRIALLRNDKIPLGRALEFARSLPAPILREILHNSHLPERTKSYLLCHLNRASEASRRSPNSR